MARTWEHVYRMSDDWEDTEHLVTEYRPGGTVSFIAHTPETDATVELVGMPWTAFLDVFEAMERHHAHDEDAEPCEDMRCRPCAWHARKGT